MSIDQQTELMQVIIDTQNRLMAAMNTDSVNIGINSGPLSGASIPEHLHVHIVPRITNDVGFFTIFCDKVPENQLKQNLRIREEFQK